MVCYAFVYWKAHEAVGWH